MVFEDPAPIYAGQENTTQATSTSSYSAHARKRAKQQPQPPRLAPLNTSSIVNYDPYPTPAFNYMPNPHAWRPEGTLSVPPPHLSPYPTDWSDSGSHYARSPVPEDRYQGHLITPTASHATTPDPSVYSHSAALAPPSSQPHPVYYSRGYLPPQPVDYLHQPVHPTYDYGSPYLTDAAWENPFNGAQPSQ